MSATAERTYTPQEQAAYDEGREAYRNGSDYFSSAYFVTEGRNLYLLTAYSEGWLEAERDAAGAQPGQPKEGRAVPEINIFKKYTPAELHNLIVRNLDNPSQMMSALTVLCGFVHDLTARVSELERRLSEYDAQPSDDAPAAALPF